MCHSCAKSCATSCAYSSLAIQLQLQVCHKLHVPFMCHSTSTSLMCHSCAIHHQFHIPFMWHSTFESIADQFHVPFICHSTSKSCAMGWLRFIGSLKSSFSFAEYRLCYRALLHKRPMILRSLLHVATPYMYTTSISCAIQLQRHVTFNLIRPTRPSNHLTSLRSSHRDLTKTISAH